MITAMHKIDEGRLEAVVSDMARLGPPVIRAAETCHGLVAIEGCHRLEAAYRLGLIPEILLLGEEEIVADHGLQDFSGPLTVAEILEYIGVPDGRCYDF